MCRAPRGAVTSVEIEDDGLTVIAPELLLALGRSTVPEGPDDEDGRYFESVLLAEPGYYERPVNAPAVHAQLGTPVARNDPTLF